MAPPDEGFGSSSASGPPHRVVEGAQASTQCPAARLLSSSGGNSVPLYGQGLSWAPAIGDLDPQSPQRVYTEGLNNETVV